MAVVIELAEGVPEHILSDGQPLCDAGCIGEDARVVPDSRDPVADASIHLCALCARRWLHLEDEVERNETVRCAIDRVEDGTMWTCCDVVAVDDARRLDHPHADQPVPACPDCYVWLLDYTGNGIDTPYEAAASWATHPSV